MAIRREVFRAPEPDYAVPPGETLRERLEELGMSQAELARRTGLTAKHINQIIQGAATLSADVAQRLELVTSVPAYWWLRLDADFQATQMRLSQQREASENDLGWVDSMPIAALVRAGALPATPRDRSSRFRQLLGFFGVASVEAYFTLWARPAAAFRQSHAYSIDEAAVSAWLRLGELTARTLPAKSFDASRLREVLSEIRALTTRTPAESLPRLVRLASECGVAVVFVPEIAGARAYGATRWIGNGRLPILQLSLRGKTDDKLWQTVFHELGHILLHDRKRVFLEVEGEPGSEQEQLEREAESFARDLIIPPDSATRLRSLATLEQVVNFADSIGVAPSLVVSRLQSEDLWTYRQGADLKHRIPDAAVQAAGGLPLAGQATPSHHPHAKTTRRRDWRLPGEGS